MRCVKWMLPLLILAVASPAFAYKVQVSEDAFLNLDVLGQSQAQSTEKAAPDGGWSKDLFLRRIRLLAFGSLSKNVSFFFETDQPNLGKNGDWAAPMFVQDAFMTVKVSDAFMVDSGMVLLPFTRHSMTGAIGLNGIDYHSKMIKFPDGTHKVWRDAGVQARGYLAEQKLQYRLGVFGGSQNMALQKDAAGKVVTSSNPGDLPRATGHVRYAIAGTETDFFAKGIYFSPTPILSVGVGVDYVPDAILTKAAVLDGSNVVTAKGQLGDHMGAAGDVFVEYPLDADNEVVFQGTALYYDDGPKAKTSGVGALTEVGYRWHSLEPVVALDYFDSEVPKADYMGAHVGLNWWMAKHATNVKLDFAFEKTGNLEDGPSVRTVTLQGQFFL
jgi:hypothetical protein